MKKVSKYLIQVSCVVIFIALFCGANDCHNSDCDNRNWNKYTIDITLKNNSDKVITMKITGDYHDLMPNGGTFQRKFTHAVEIVHDPKVYTVSVWAYLGPYIPGVTERVLLGKKEVVIDVFEESVNEKGEPQRYAQCIVEYPW